MIRSFRCAVPTLLIAVSLPALLRAQPAPREIVLATTTSMAETGLLDALGPLFTARTGYRFRAVAVGSGQAMAIARRGDADALLVHSPAAEAEFMAAGHGVRRRPVASNYFTIIGPAGDPAGVRRAADAAAALRAIAAAAAVFVSRGDSSGTHARELRLWGAGGVPRWPGYLEAGQGMSAVLLIAGERRGYTLTDLATFGTLRARLDLVALRDQEPALRNDYSVIELAPGRRGADRVEGGRRFVEFMVSDTVQTLLRSFGADRFGAPLFIPAR